MWFSTNPPDSIAQFTPQLGEIETARVPQLDAFQVGPEILATIEFRRISAELLEMNLRGHPNGQKRFDHLAAMTSRMACSCVGWSWIMDSKIPWAWSG